LGGRLHRCAGPVQPAARDGVVGGAAGRGAAGLCDPEAPDPSLRGIRMNGSRPFRVARVLAAALVYGFLLGPMLVVALFSFSDKSFFAFPPSGFSLRGYRAAWESGPFLAPAVRCLALAALSTLIAAAFSIPAALALRRTRSPRLRAIVEFLFLSPLIVPALI